LQEVRSDAAQRRHATPERKRQCNQVASIVAIRVTRDGNAENDVEHRKSGTYEEAQPRVRYTELITNRRQQNREYLPVYEVEHVHDGQDGQRVSSGSC
jgi:hypothetical protein